LGGIAAEGEEFLELVHDDQVRLVSRDIGQGVFELGDGAASGCEVAHDQIGVLGLEGRDETGQHERRFAGAGRPPSRL